jgi:ABC-type transport system involved in multi-copper enzyme maturation permease subunit
MSSRAIREGKDAKHWAKRWQAPAEAAPSVMDADKPLLARIVGGIGVVLMVFAAVALIALQADKPLLRGEIGYGRAGFLGVVGIVMMLLHAASDAELQIRRSYMVFGYVWILFGIGSSILPLPNQPAGTQFLPKGVPCLVLGLLFLMAFVRNETEEIFRLVAVRVIGVLGAAAAIGGLFCATIFADFLIFRGTLLCLIGLLYLSVYVAQEEEAKNWGYWAALGMGAAGMLTFMIALGRSISPPLAIYFNWTDTPPASYLIPWGLVLMCIGLAYFFFGVGACSDNSLVVLTRRELAAFFQTPIAYIVLIGYAFIAWCLYLLFIFQVLVRYDAREGYTAQSAQEPIVLNYFLGWFQIICLLFIVPVLTMRLLSEERRTGTLEMLLSAPLNEVQIVLSKFFAAWCFFVLTWLPLGLYLIGLYAEGRNPFDYRPVLGFYIALAISGAGFVSLGLFFSSLTRNQIAAAILTFAGILLLTFVFFIGRFFQVEEGVRNMLSYLSYVQLWIWVCDGKLAVRDLIFHVSATIFWLFLTVKVLEARKWL